MYTLTLDLLRQTIAPQVSGFRCELIKVSGSPSRLERVWLSYATPAPAPASIVAKIIAPDWPGDPHGADRELIFYTRLVPQMGIATPRLFHAGTDAATGYRVLLMEDFLARRQFPPPTHVWTPPEARCMLRAYAALHALGTRAVPPEAERGWLWPRHETLLHNEALPRMAHELAQQPFWPPVAGLDALLAWALDRAREYASLPVTLLHGDVYPPNVGLPADLDDEAILIDWEMAGTGLAELDLAYLFMQPFAAERNLVRDEMLDYYWAQRASIEGHLPSTDDRRARQLYGDAVLALTLLPVAHKVAMRPFAPGSPPAAYWERMFGILNRRLRALADEIVGETE